MVPVFADVAMSLVQESLHHLRLSTSLNELSQQLQTFRTVQSQRVQRLLAKAQENLKATHAAGKPFSICLEKLPFSIK
jgi:hypothetical protein